jgi:radical SAM/Cys-rich protein
MAPQSRQGRIHAGVRRVTLFVPLPLQAQAGKMYWLRVSLIASVNRFHQFFILTLLTRPPMRATLPLLKVTDFPPISRGKLTTLQVNLGYRCNQTCLHCHVNAGPTRTEEMSRETIDEVLALARAAAVSTLDLTGGAPELNPHFRDLVREARSLGIQVIDRCNLTILSVEGQETLAEFLAEQRVDITASLPCYLEDNVEKQRGKGVFAQSIAGLQRLNALGYGQPGSGLTLNLVYNPQGPSLPPAQASLEADYKRHLGENFGVVFNQLYTLANMPIQRFGSTLVTKGQFAPYMQLLRGAHRDENLDTVMCRSLISIDYQGNVYDCDFNQMLGLPLQVPGEIKPRHHIRDLIGRHLDGAPIMVADHCFGCTAGQGSSCGGALN